MYQNTQALWLRTLTLDNDAWNCTFWDNQSHCVTYPDNSGCRDGRGRRAIAGERSVLCLSHLTFWLHPSKKTGSWAVPREENTSQANMSKTKPAHLHLFNQPQNGWFTAGFVLYHLSCFSHESVSYRIFILHEIVCPVYIYFCCNQECSTRLYDHGCNAVLLIRKADLLS